MGLHLEAEGHEGDSMEAIERETAARKAPLRAGGLVHSSTPMMNQFNQLKRHFLDCILFFQAGEFYEMFGEDAELASEILGIALTSRHKNMPNPLAMCGVPCHSYQQYLNKLVEAGYKVALADQVEPCAPGKLVERQVVRVATPGTLLTDIDAREGRSHYLLSVWQDREEIGGVLSDVTTGQLEFFQLKENALEQLVGLCEIEHPREVLLPPLTEVTAKLHEKMDGLAHEGEQMRLEERPLLTFSEKNTRQRLEKLYQVQGLDGFGLGEMPLALRACGALLDYLDQIHYGLEHLYRPRVRSDSDVMRLDEISLRHLEVFSSKRQGDSGANLFGMLNRGGTPMGSRMLRRWLVRPLLDKQQIEHRLDAVERLIKDADLRCGLQACFLQVKDLERMVGRVSSPRVGIADLVALRDALCGLEGLPQWLNSVVKTAKNQQGLLWQLANNFDPVDEVREHLQQRYLQEPQLKLSEGGYIAEGVSRQLDELRALSKNSREVMTQLEQKERKRTGINSLKLRYNRVFGYYVELPKIHASKVPPEYRRKQTLANAERFTLDTLQELEEKLLSAQQRAYNIEQELFEETCKILQGYLRRIQQTAERVATLDVLCTLAEVAHHNNYCRPELLEKDAPVCIQIEHGRHPLLEKLSSEPFIPNDVHLQADQQQIILITGPNMAGKSTVMRQTALIQLMAQAGSFVPAKHVRISLIEQIFTRIGADDNLVRGQSTFMMEMTETANILNNANPNSLIILDEIGRGTSTYDGISIAWAVAEYLHQAGPLTLFATHYHELTALEDILPRFANHSMLVHEQKNQLLFARKLIPGPSDRSHGIQVAKLAGLPHNVIQRASQVVKQLVAKSSPKQQPALFQPHNPNNTPPKPRSPLPPPHPALETLKNLQIDKITPLEALNLIHQLRDKLHS